MKMRTKNNVPSRDTGSGAESANKEKGRRENRNMKPNKNTMANLQKAKADSKNTKVDAKTAADLKKEAVMRTLITAPEIFALMSFCTKLPFVMCDPETYDDEVFLYRKEEDVKREGQKFLDKKIPLQIVKVENKDFLNFYMNLFTMGVNCIVLNGFMKDEYKLQLADLVKKPGSNPQKGQIWIENPSLHLTTIYFMQEIRRQKFETLPDELKEMQDEILADFEKGTFLAALQADNGIPLLKQKNGDTFQPIFTDIFEFRKFDRENKFKVIPVRAGKLPEILAKEALGVVVNPMGINLQLPMMKRPAPTANGENRPAPAANGEKQPASAASEGNTPTPAANEGKKPGQKPNED